MYFKDFPKILYDFDITSGQTAGVQATAYANLASDGVGSVADVLEEIDGTISTIDDVDSFVPWPLVEEVLIIR